jgi:hypothetical protein
MAKGNNTNIIVGAAALFLHKGAVDEVADDFEALALSGSSSAIALLTADDDNFENVGYTSNGLELDFQPDFGEVKVDQLLDVARLYKQGMKVNLKTTFAEATLENLLVAIAANTDDKTTDGNLKQLNLTAGELGDYPVERGIVAVGPGTYDKDTQSTLERIYVAYRALSIENVTVSAKREEATMFAVSFRLLPTDEGSYGKIVDRTPDVAS